MRRSYVLPLVSIVIVGCAFFAGRADAQGGAAPGSSQDPLASVSYVAQAIQTALTQQVPSLITQALGPALTQQVPPLVTQGLQSALPGVVTPLVQSTVQSALANQPQGGGAQVAVVTVLPGEKLVAQQGTEFILRGGSAAVSLAATSAGGFSDLTGGVDLAQGAKVPPNHLLLAARTDGRAIAPVGLSRLLVIVMGQYTLEPAS